MAYAKLKGRMYELELNQNEIARRTGMTAAQLSSRMHGHVCFSLDEMYRIGDVLGIPDAELIIFFPRGKTVQSLNCTKFPQVSAGT